MDDFTESELNGFILPRLREIAKQRGITGYSKLKKSELIDTLLNRRRQKRSSVTPEYSSFEQCVNSPRSEVVDSARQMGIETVGKTKETICNNLVVASAKHKKKEKDVERFIERCVGSPRKELEILARKKGISTEGKSKRQICEELVSTTTTTVATAVDPRQEFIEECSKRTKSEVVALAKKRGIKVTGIESKRELCEILANSVIDIGLIEQCVASTSRSELVDEAERSGVKNISRKTSEQLCEDLVIGKKKRRRRIIVDEEDEKISSRKKKKKDPREEFIESCVGRRKQEVIELALKRGLIIGDKSKRQLCEELADSVIAKGIEEKRVERQIEENRVEREIEEEQVETNRQIEECISTTSRPEIIDIAERTTDIAIPASSSSLDLCEEIVDVTGQPWNVVALKWFENEWLDIVEALTDKREDITPERLAAETSRQALEDAYVTTTKLDRPSAHVSSERIARDLYDFLHNCYLGEDVDESLDDIVAENVQDETVGKQIVEDIRHSVSQHEDDIDDTAKSLYALSISEITSPRRIARNSVEREIALNTIDEAELFGSISDEEADAVRNRLLSPSERGCQQPPAGQIVIDRKVSAARRKDVEALIAEIKEPKTRVSELALVQRRVYQLLGLVSS